MQTVATVDRPQAPLSRDALITSPDLAERIHKAPRTIENWRTSGKGPCFIKTGPRGVLYQWGDVLDWLDGRKVNSTSESIAA